MGRPGYVSHQWLLGHEVRQERIVEKEPAGTLLLWRRLQSPALCGHCSGPYLKGLCGICKLEKEVL